MYGSDWPVCTSAATYDDVLVTARELIGPGAADQVLAATATRVYGL